MSSAPEAHDPIALATFAERYVNVWNEPSPERRREHVAALWAEDGAHLSAAREAHGHAELEARVALSFERWGTLRYTFHLRRPPVAHHGAVAVRWEMRSPDGTTESLGTDVLLLAADGRIGTAYQFVED